MPTILAISFNKSTDYEYGTGLAMGTIHLWKNRERIAWKLENDDTKLARSYYRAIIDEELFLLLSLSIYGL